ncbi:hypothetical protein M0811_06325 [Anaeramoeba ignava]|uniref:Uncharacterized protein n=1 Tax=Anaeramoeba ignava TaxID=1746090 RepID=A0A9Q0LMM0_ANAIG|nr:hypothetical protein M0811_06325 [Anaeramoeba ignava]
MKKKKVNETVQMIGSFPPKKEIFEFTSPYEEVLTGEANTKPYKGIAQFSDDDGRILLDLNYTFQLVKEWKD